MLNLSTSCWRLEIRKRMEKACWVRRLGVFVTLPINHQIGVNHIRPNKNTHVHCSFSGFATVYAPFRFFLLNITSPRGLKTSNDVFFLFMSAIRKISSWQNPDYPWMLTLPFAWKNGLWKCRGFRKLKSNNGITRLQFCPLYICGNNPPHMVPMDLNIGFQGLALIQGQIYNPESLIIYLRICRCLKRFIILLWDWLVTIPPCSSGGIPTFRILRHMYIIYILMYTCIYRYRYRDTSASSQHSFPEVI